MDSGAKLGHYEALSLLGKGGMGEVWRARDTKLGRDVAIKTLPEEFAKDADRLTRFEREAKLLASLNHPNIAAIYGLEESNGTRFLVLGLVDGDTLADRLKRGAIPVEDSLKLALQIAEALKAASARGRPSNPSAAGCPTCRRSRALGDRGRKWSHHDGRPDRRHRRRRPDGWEADRGRNSAQGVQV